MNFQFVNLFPIEYDSDKDFTKIQIETHQELAIMLVIPRGGKENEIKIATLHRMAILAENEI